MEKKKLIYVGASVMGVMILLIIVIALVSSGGKGSTYEKIERNLIDAAKEYYTDNENLLPITNNAYDTVNSEVLENKGYMKKLSSMVGKNASCTANVTIVKSKDTYLYIPYLDCGNDYKTVTLLEKLKENITTSGEGLYANNNGFVFKGEHINNYVSLGEKLWVVIDIDDEGYIRMIYAGESLGDDFVWDDRYNVDKEDYVGINDYNVSRIKETLESLESSYKVLPEDSTAYVAYRSWCIGKRDESNKKLDLTEECSEIIENQMFGLPYITDYYNSSLDPNCIDLDSKSCSNYNYMKKISISGWLLNPSKNNTYKAFGLTNSGATISATSSQRTIKPTIYLNNKVIYSSGIGTKKDPYILK